jgi:ABC-type Zn uptake system ZnuABC Zn-binding protein ZnuA
MDDTRPSMRLSLNAFRGPVVILLFAVLFVGCNASSSAPPSSGGGGRLPVVATTTVFAEMIQEVGGDFVAAASLVPANGDVHTFEPAPSDIRTVATAKLLVMNGLGLDDWLEKTITNASASGTTLVKLGVELPGVEYIGSGTEVNPHLWLNVGYGLLYVDRIEQALAQADPAHASAYATQAAAYKAHLSELDAEVRRDIATIPAANRKLVAFHDAFPYYARAYGITIVGVAVAAPGQDPSAAYTAQLIDAIRAAGVKAIFSEAQFPRKLIDALAAETGTTVVADLYDDALGDPPITTYEAIIHWDTEQLVMALT